MFKKRVYGIKLPEEFRKHSAISIQHFLRNAPQTAFLKNQAIFRLAMTNFIYISIFRD